MTHHRKSKWNNVIAELQADPGNWHKVAEDAAPSVTQRLRALGAEVQTDSSAPRTGGATYSRYTVWVQKHRDTETQRR